MLSPPLIIDVNGEWEDILRRLYEVFKRDFKTSKTYHREDIVVYDNRIMPDGHGMEEGFWHVITKGPVGRTLDTRRAERLSWAKPLMENHLAKNVKYWNYDTGTKEKGIRTYIWLQDKDYLIILQKKRSYYFWVTAFYVDSQKYKDELLRKYYQRV
jgi:hypothetical protein